MVKEKEMYHYELTTNFYTEGSYWGNFKVNEDTEECIKNRNIFYKNFNIDKYDAKNKKERNPQIGEDHNETYTIKNSKNKILITSPYCSEGEKAWSRDPEKIKKLENDGWIRLPYNLYTDTGSISFYKLIVSKS